MGSSRPTIIEIIGRAGESEFDFCADYFSAKVCRDCFLLILLCPLVLVQSPALKATAAAEAEAATVGLTVTVERPVLSALQSPREEGSSAEFAAAAKGHRLFVLGEWRLLLQILQLLSASCFSLCASTGRDWRRRTTRLPSSTSNTYSRGAQRCQSGARGNFQTLEANFGAPRDAEVD